VVCDLFVCLVLSPSIYNSRAAQGKSDPKAWGVLTWRGTTAFVVFVLVRVCQFAVSTGITNDRIKPIHGIHKHLWHYIPQPGFAPVEQPATPTATASATDGAASASGAVVAAIPSAETVQTAEPSATAPAAAVGSAPAIS